MKTLDEFQKEVGEWGEVTFPKSYINSVIDHFDDESKELIGNFKDEEGNRFSFVSYTNADEEAADCVLLLLHYCHKRDISLMQLMEDKMKVNRERKWGKPDERGVVRHVD